MEKGGTMTFSIYLMKRKEDERTSKEVKREIPLCVVCMHCMCIAKIMKNRNYFEPSVWPAESFGRKDHVSFKVQKLLQEFFRFGK